MKNLLSIADLDVSEIKELLFAAEKIKKTGFPKKLLGKVLAICFFEPSTRTRLSFESAMLRLGGTSLGFSDQESISSKKGESLFDTIKVVGSYADVLVVRHFEKGAARVAASATSTPVINGGDGSNEHPTQTLTDLFSIKECQGRLEGLSIIIAGDLLYGRAVHSLVLALRLFSPRLFFVAPPALQISSEICGLLQESGIEFSLHSCLEEVIEKGDILYMTRLQKERHGEGSFASSPFRVTSALLEKAPSHLRILHPLPRVEEIAKEVDETKQSYYFTQAENGVFLRAALLLTLLEGS